MMMRSKAQMEMWLATAGVPAPSSEQLSRIIIINGSCQKKGLTTLLDGGRMEGVVIKVT